VALSNTTRHPGWTDNNESDPGVPLLELLAYVIELRSRRFLLPLGLVGLVLLVWWRRG
jgi:hypothetical protein